MSRNSNIRGMSPGITLVEILIAIALLGLVMGGIAVGAGAFRGVALRNASSRVAALVSFASHESIIKGRPLRIAIDLGAQGYRLEAMVEQGDKAASYLKASEKESSRDESERDEPFKSGISLGVADMIQPPPMLRPKPQWQPLEDASIKVEPLPKDLVFASMFTSQLADPLAEGTGYLYFWPNGQSERALLWLSFAGAEDEDNDAFYSILVEPLSGKAVVKQGKAELPRNLEDFDEPEEVEEEKGKSGL
jgi:general secretion pathway protein H